jgi:hypothetical protein
MTEDLAPRRRGRPPLTQSDAPALNEAATENVSGAGAPEPEKRRRRASVGGHAMKLQAPGRAGFTRRWFNDDGNRIADADELGYDYVTDKGIKTSSPGSRVSRLVGTKANGEPLHAYLMETPNELYAEGLAEKEAFNRQIDDAIVAGRDSTGQLVSNETYGSGSIQRDR